MSGTSGATQSHIPISPGSFSAIKEPKAIPINTLDKKTLDTAHGILESYNNTWSKPEALSERSITQEHLHDTPTNDEIDFDALAQKLDFSFNLNPESSSIPHKESKIETSTTSSSNDEEIDYDALAQEIDFSFDIDKPKPKNGSPIEKEIKPDTNPIAPSNEEEIDYDALAQEIDFSFDMDEPKPKNGSPIEKEIKPDIKSITPSNEEEIDYDALAQEIDFSFDMDEPKPKNGSPIEKEIKPDTKSITPSNEEEIDYDALAQEIDFDFSAPMDIDETKFRENFVSDRLAFQKMLAENNGELDWVEKMSANLDSLMEKTLLMHEETPQLHKEVEKEFPISQNNSTTNAAKFFGDFIQKTNSWRILESALTTYTDPTDSQKYILKEDIEKAPDLLVKQYRLEIQEKMFKHQNDIYINSPDAFFSIDSPLEKDTIRELTTLPKEKQIAFLNAHSSGEVKKLDLEKVERMLKNEAKSILSSYLLSQNIKIVASKNELIKILGKKASFNPRKEVLPELQNKKQKHPHKSKKIDNNFLDSIHDNKSQYFSRLDRKRANSFQMSVEQRQMEKKRKFYKELGELEKIKERSLQLILKEELHKSEFIHQFQHALDIKKRNFHMKRVPSAA